MESICHEVIIRKDKIKDLKDHLDKKAFLAYAEMMDFLARENIQEEVFRKLANIVEKGAYYLSGKDQDKNKFIKIIDKRVSKEILFMTRYL